MTFIEIDAPPLNLLTMELRASIRAVAASVASDSGVRALVVRSTSPKAFSAGSDVKEFPSDAPGGIARAAQEQACFNALASTPQPVIAELSGHVLGGGLELALACDIRIADESARLALPEAGLGVFPTGGGTQRVTQLLGPSRAKLFMMLGTIYTAQEAHDAGLVDRVVPAGELSATVRALAARIADQPGRAVQAIKAAVDHGQHYGPVAGQAMEQQLARLYGSHDAAEGVRAFLDSRIARFDHS